MDDKLMTCFCLFCRFFLLVMELTFPRHTSNIKLDIVRSDTQLTQRDMQLTYTVAVTTQSVGDLNNAKMQQLRVFVSAGNETCC